jgi:DNA-binding LytR/AlgR family response regulator
MLHILAVDDEVPALEELAYLLRRDPRVAEVQTANDAPEALLGMDRAVAAGRPLDAVFLDIGMPGLNGLDLARVLSRFARPPRVVFITAHEDYAVEAFTLRAADYVLKPVHPDRLAEAVRRVAEEVRETADGASETAAGTTEEVISVELAGVTRFVPRSEVLYAEAQGDYARLHTATGSHLVRTPLTALEERWAQAGFVRIHRSHLVALRHVRELRLEAGRTHLRLGDQLLPVSRRHARRVRDLLVRQPPPSATGPYRDGAP